MSNYESVALIDFQPDGTDQTVSTQTCETSSLEEVEALIKCAIWSRCSKPGQLINISMNCSEFGNSRPEVKLKFNNLGGNSVKEFSTKSSLQQQAGLGASRFASTRLHQKLDIIPC